MAVRPAPNPSDNVNAPLNACLWDRRAARRHARTVHPARSVPPAVPTPTAPVYCAPSPRSSAATAAALLTAGPHRLASPPGSLLCSSSAAPFPLGDGVVGTTHSQAGREPPLPIQISTFGGTLPATVPCRYTRLTIDTANWFLEQANLGRKDGIAALGWESSDLRSSQPMA